MIRPKNTSARPFATITPPTAPTPTAFCARTNSGQTPVTPNATHWAAIHALFVQTSNANDVAGYSV